MGDNCARLVLPGGVGGNCTCARQAITGLAVVLCASWCDVLHHAPRSMRPYPLAACASLCPRLQPMSMRNYPWDTFQLETQLTLTDTSRLVVGHPGLRLIPSAASLEVRTSSKAGDASLPVRCSRAFVRRPHPALPTLHLRTIHRCRVSILRATLPTSQMATAWAQTPRSSCTASTAQPGTRCSGFPLATNAWQLYVLHWRAVTTPAQHRAAEPHDC